MDIGVATVIAAVVAALSLVWTTVLATKTERRTRTRNGKTVGHLIESIATRVAAVEIKLDHHYRDPDAHTSAEEIERR